MKSIQRTVLITLIALQVNSLTCAFSPHRLYTRGHRTTMNPISISISMSISMSMSMSSTPQERRRRTTTTTSAQTISYPKNEATDTAATAADIINQVLYPPSEYKKRMNVGKDAQFGTSDKNQEGVALAIDANDPRLSLTYHEFPLESMDELLDLAIGLYEDRNHGCKPRVLVDLGSGCGRLVLYAALASMSEHDNGNGNDNDIAPKWKQVHGIEIGSEMHEYAVDIMSRGVDEGYLHNNLPVVDEEDASSSTTATTTTNISFHQGAASELTHILSQADIVFCYSTVFDAEGFNVDMGAMVLAKEWSQMLANVCREGAVVVTTDKALNPEHGWVLKHAVEVANPSLLGSTGYISFRQ